MAGSDEDLPPNASRSESESEEDPPLATESEPNRKQERDEFLFGRKATSTRSEAAKAFDGLDESLPSTLGVSGEEVRAVVRDLLRELPDGWSTPRYLPVTAEPYSGRPRVVQRLIATDLPAAENAAETRELLQDRILPAIRRLELGGATREEIGDIATVLLRELPSSEGRSELARNAARYVLREPDETQRGTTGYHMTIVDLGNALSGQSADEEIESAVMYDRILLGMRSIQESGLSEFERGSADARQVQIAAHNLAATLLRLAQGRRDRTATPFQETRRLQVLSAAFDSFSSPPSEVESLEFARRVGLEPFLGRKTNDEDAPELSPNSVGRAKLGLLLVQAVGSIGASADIESVHEPLASAISACCAIGWSDSPGRSAARFYNAAVALDRVAASSSSVLQRTTLLALAVGSAFATADSAAAAVRNSDALDIGAAYAGTVASSFGAITGPAARSLVGVLAGFVQAAGLVSLGAGSLRGDAIRIVDAATRLRIADTPAPKAVSSEVALLAARACDELIGGTSEHAAEWSLPWVAGIVGRVFVGPLDATKAEGGLLWQLPGWIDKISRPSEVLRSYGTPEWRRGLADGTRAAVETWEPSLVYGGQVTSEDWQRVQASLDKPVDSMAEALALYLQSR